MFSATSPTRRVGVSLVLAAALVPYGCGPGLPATYPAQGAVSYKGGTGAAKPLIGGHVRLESVSDPKTFARGEVQEDGTFALVMYKDGRSYAGLITGDYRARVEPPGYDDYETDEERAKKLKQVKPQYLSYDKSGLKFQIEPRENTLKVEVEK